MKISGKMKNEAKIRVKNILGVRKTKNITIMSGKISDVSFIRETLKTE